MGKKKIDYDKIFLRVFVGLIAITVVFFFTVLVSWFFEIDITSIHLWLGAFVVFLSFYSIYITPIPWKIMVIFVSILAIALYLFFVFGWSIKLSLMVGLLTVIFLVFGYLVI